MALRDDLLSGLANRQTKIAFPNGEYATITSGILSGSLELDEILSTSNVLDFSELNANRFQCVYSQNIDFTGKKITVSQTIGSNSITLFTGFVESCNVVANSTNRTLIAYDPMYKLRNKDVATWYNGLTFPITIKNFRDQMFQYVGYTQVTTSLVNDSITITKEMTPTTLLFGDVFSDICELNGVFGHFNRAGLCKYIDLTNTTTNSISDNYSSLSMFENYTTDVITGVALSTSDDSISEIIGTQTNIYNVVGNMLTFGFDSAKLITVGTNLYNKVKTITFKPSNIVTKYSEPTIELGNKITLTTYTSQSVTTFALSQTFRGVQLLNHTIESISDKTRAGFTQSDSSKIDVLNNKSHVFRNNIDELYSRIETAEGYYSEINQTGEQISWIVGSGTSESDFTLTDRTADLVSAYINLNGLVEFNGISAETQYLLNGVTRNTDFSVWDGDLPFGFTDHDSLGHQYLFKTVENGANYIRYNIPNNTTYQAISTKQSTEKDSFFTYNVNLKDKKYLYYETKIKLASGILSGSGLQFKILSYINGGSSIYETNINVRFSSKIPTPTLGEWYIIKGYLDLPESVSSEMYAGIYLNVFGNHPIMGSMAAKDLYIASISCRTASYGEYLADNLGVDGTTYINGGLIATNTILGDSINTTDLFSKDITYTGKITGGNVTGGGLIQSYNYTVDDDGECTAGMLIDLKNGTLTNNNVKIGQYSVNITSDTGRMTIGSDTIYSSIDGSSLIISNGDVETFITSDEVRTGDLKLTGFALLENNNSIYSWNNAKNAIPNLLRLTTGDNVAIGDTTSDNILLYPGSDINYVSIEYVDGTARLRYNGSVVTGSGTTAMITSGGYIVKSGSSRKYKENFDYNLEDCEEIIKALKPCRFNFKGYDFTNIGLIAEDVEQVSDQLVIRDADGNVDAVHYNDILIMLLQVVQKMLNNQ